MLSRLHLLHSKWAAIGVSLVLLYDTHHVISSRGAVDQAVQPTRSTLPTLPADLQVRQDAGLVAKSKLEILCAEGDMYVSRTTGKHGSVMLKMGPRYDMGSLCPKPEDGWQKVSKGKDYCVWLKMHEADERN